ncbi:MAG: prepilin-type N-terminal cleavage/methylation domain-containing protein [Candidatus Pacearchaeota archaeon]
MKIFFQHIEHLKLFKLKNKKGFTLIELLIVIAVLGILVGIAVPLYLGERAKAMHTEAKTNLESIRLLEEQFFANNGNYGADGTYTYKGTYETSDGGIEDILPGFKPGDIDSLKFSYTIVISSNGTSFLATATGKAGTPVKNTSFSIDNNNVRNF